MRGPCLSSQQNRLLQLGEYGCGPPPNQDQEPESRFLKAEEGDSQSIFFGNLEVTQWDGQRDRESAAWSFASGGGVGTKGYLIHLPATSHHHGILRPFVL